MNNNKVQTEQMLVFQQQTPALKTTHSLFDKVTFIKVNVPLRVSILLFVTQHRHGPPPHLLPSDRPSTYIMSIYLNRVLWCPSCAFSRCFTAAPYMPPSSSQI